jgi:hypothetical protein
MAFRPLFAALNSPNPAAYEDPPDKEGNSDDEERWTYLQVRQPFLDFK